MTLHRKKPKMARAAQRQAMLTVIQIVVQLRKIGDRELRLLRSIRRWHKAVKP